MGLRLHNLKPAEGATKRRKRVGRGESSGHGKTSGKGHKGQKARSGGSIRIGFEGGQMPLYRRLPKRGFSNAAFKEQFAIVNLDDLDKAFETGATVDRESLRAKGLIGGRLKKVKILGRGEVTKGFYCLVDGITASAKAKIEKAGGSVQVGKAA